jgi:hypothetical protein
MNVNNNSEQVSAKASAKEQIKAEIDQSTDTNLADLQQRIDKQSFEAALEQFANTYEARISSMAEALRSSSLAELANVSNFERRDFVNTALAEIELMQQEITAIRGNIDGDMFERGQQAISLIAIEARLARFREILGQINVVEEDVEQDETVERFETASNMDEFLQLNESDRLRMICGVGLEQLSVGTTLRFQFPDEEMEYQIGIGDLLPAEYRTVESNGVVYTRQGSQGFYNNGIYLAVFNGSRVRINSEPEEYSAEEELASKFTNENQELSTYEANDELVEGLGSVDRAELFEQAMSFMIDPFLLQSVISLLWDSFSGEFGSEEEFMHMAARFIQNAENSYRRVEGNTPVTNGFYSLEFLVYTLDHFNLFNYRTQQFDQNTIESVIEKYGELKGVTSLQSVELNLEETRTTMEQAYRRPFADVTHNYSEAITRMSDVQMREQAGAYADRVMTSLEAQGENPEVAAITRQASEILYYNMFDREGTPYSGRVDIVSVDGDRWNINNNCVGHTMRVLAGTPFAVLSGRQSGFGESNNRRGHDAVYASNWYWGDYNRAPGEVRENYLQSIVSDRSDIIGYGRGMSQRYYEGETQYEVVIDEYNVDELLGQHLADGEMAVIQFPSHVAWIYKDGEQIMLSHSPRAGRDVVTLPLARYVHYNHPEYVRIVPLTTLVEDNLADNSRSESFRQFFANQSLS